MFFKFKELNTCKGIYSELNFTYLNLTFDTCYFNPEKIFLVNKFESAWNSSLLLLNLGLI